MRSSLILFALLAAPLIAETRSLDISAAQGYQRAVQTFPDPVYVGENNYVAATALQTRVRAQFMNFFPASFDLSYQALNVQSGEKSLFGKTYSMRGYFSSFLRAGSHLDTRLFRWHFGFAALATFARRSHYDESTAHIVSDTSVDTRLSQTYPSGGFTLFPKAPIRFSLVFLSGDANLLYGWLRMEVEFETDAHILSAGAEMLNHASFGRGMPNFVQPPGAIVLGYGYKMDGARFGIRLGFVLNSTQGFDNARVSIADRLIFEFSAGYKFQLAGR